MLNLALKRAFDITLSTIGIVLTSPLLLAICLILLVTQGKPIFYRATRTGLSGKPFPMWKFRTMVNNADRMGGAITGKNDPRLTPLGGFLRRYKLDELPQFFNVLKGDMSIVGPRPESIEYTNNYTNDELRILSMKPGITDWACIEYNNLEEIVGDTDPDGHYREHVLHRKNQLRLKYVDEWSLQQDVEIVVKTGLVVASKPFRKSA